MFRCIVLFYMYYIYIYYTHNYIDIIYIYISICICIYIYISICISIIDYVSLRTLDVTVHSRQWVAADCNRHQAEILFTWLWPMNRGVFHTEFTIHFWFLVFVYKCTINIYKCTILYFHALLYKIIYYLLNNHDSLLLFIQFERLRHSTRRVRSCEKLQRLRSGILGTISWV